MNKYLLAVEHVRAFMPRSVSLVIFQVLMLLLRCLVRQVLCFVIDFYYYRKSH